MNPRTSTSSLLTSNTVRKFSSSLAEQSKDNEEEKRKEDIEKEKQDRIEDKTRRWGDTKRKHEQEKDEKLKTMTMKEVLIINSDSQKIFVNRFNSMCTFFFFPLVVPLR